MNKKELTLRTVKLVGFLCFATVMLMILVAFEPLKSLWDMLYEFGGRKLQHGVQGGILGLAGQLYRQRQKKRDEEKHEENDAP
jgi:hypothetical protein